MQQPPPYSKFTRTSWIINAVDGMQWRGQQQELDYVEAERGRLPEQRSHLGYNNYPG